MTDRLLQIREGPIEWTWSRGNWGNENLKVTIFSTIMRDQKQLESVEYFSYLASLRACDAGCKHEIKFRIVITKAAFDKKKIHV